MNYYQLSLIFHSLISASDVIFSGLKVIVPIIFLLNFYRTHYTRIEWPVLIVSLNLSMLTGGVFFLSAFIGDTVSTLVREGVAGLDFMLSIATGVHGYQLILPLFVYAVLPQILWFRKIRNSVYSSFLIVISWWLSYYIISYLNGKENSGFSQQPLDIKTLILGYSWQTLVLIPYVAGIYFYVLIRKKRLRSRSGDHS